MVSRASGKVGSRNVALTGFPGDNEWGGGPELGMANTKNSVGKEKTEILNRPAMGAKAFSFLAFCAINALHLASTMAIEGE